MKARSVWLQSAAAFALAAATAEAQQPPLPGYEAVEGWTMSVRVAEWSLVAAEGADSGRPAVTARGYSGRGFAGSIRPADVPRELRTRAVDTITEAVVEVDASGTATGCSVTAASTEPRLDAIACALLPTRARYEPAYVVPGRPVASRWTVRIFWRTMDPAASAQAERERAQRPMPGPPAPPPPSPGSALGSWPRLQWSNHVVPAALPRIDRDYPPAAGRAEGMVSLDLTLTPSEGITGCRIGVGSGNAALDEAACRVARRIELRYAQACGVCVDDPVPLQVVWRRRGSHIRFPLPTLRARADSAAALRDPADRRTAETQRTSPVPLAFQIGPADFADIPDRTLVERRLLSRIEVDREGRVAACAPTTSSGNRAVDERVCSLLLSRQHYLPATDVFGDPAPATLIRGVILSGIQ